VLVDRFDAGPRGAPYLKSGPNLLGGRAAAAVDEIIGAGDASFMARARARLQKIVHTQRLICEKYIWTDKRSMAPFGAPS
jgi:hypothetical protein